MARYIDRPQVDSADADWSAYLEGLAPAELEEYEAEPLKTDYPSGLDGHESGHPQIGDINGLSRTNYFNGRYLDAEALRRDQVYFARRDRLVAQTEHAGIAWGLGLEYPRVSFHNDEAGLTTASTVVLRPGVAFDGDGRPILVDRPFGFTLSELLTEYAQNPSRAVRPASRFQPCVCVERLPGNEDAGPEHPTGAYILVISPTARSEGSARVYADPCAKDRNVHCDADAWRHAFRLSLVRYPEFQHEIDDQEEGPDRCRIRGMMAAHYFDIWERNLGERWRPDFARDHRFCEGLGPFQRAPGAVALAMAFITSGGDVLVFDPWIPRRYQISSASRAWEAAVRGAPTPTASVARRHQFQCQLTECLDTALAINSSIDLHSLGVRHMAPCGFLPIDLPPGTLESREERWRQGTDAVHEAARIASVMKAANRYFAGTNILPRYRVALYEDDIFEEMGNAAEKDPLIVREADVKLWYCLEKLFLGAGYSFARVLDQVAQLQPPDVDPFEKVFDNPSDNPSDNPDGDDDSMNLARFFCCLAAGDPHTLETVVNREWSLIDVVIPMWGRRLHNRRKQLSPDMEKFVASYEANDPPDADQAPGTRARDTVDDIVGDSIAAREWVFFVKRRLVFDAWIYLILDALFDSIAYFRLLIRSNPDAFPGGANCIFTPDYQSDDQMEVRPPKTRTAALVEKRRMMAKKGGQTPELELDESTVFMASLLRRSRPELRSAAVLEEFDSIAGRRSKIYLSDGLDKAEAAEKGRYDAIDVMLEEYPGFGDYKALTLIDPRLAAAVHDDLKSEATGSAPIAAEVFTPAEVDELKPGQRAIYNVARREFGSATVSVGAKKLGRNELLHTSPEELEKLDTGAKKVAEETAKDGRKLKRAALRVAESSVSGPKLARAYEDAVIEHGEDAALDQLEKQRGLKTVAGDLRAIKDVVGAKGLDRILLTMRNQ